MAGRPKRREAEEPTDVFADEKQFMHERPTRKELAGVLDFDGVIGHPINDPVLEEYRLGVKTAADRSLAAVRMNQAFYTYSDIAWHLGYPDAKAVHRDIVRVLSAGVVDEDVEQIRAKVKAASETMLRRSLAMASAAEIELEDGSTVRNVEQRAWHAEARADLKQYAEVTGAARAQKHDISIDSPGINELVAELVEQAGHSVYESDPLEIIDVPEEPDGS